jgi:L-malate glycosyltransferase
MHIGIAGPCSTTQLSEYIFNYSDSLPAGMGGIPVNNLVIELIKKNYEVSVFSLSPDLPEGKSRVIKGKNLTIYYGHYRKRARYRIMDLFRKEANLLKGFINQAKPDVIHAHWQYEFAWPALNWKNKTILTCHDSPLRVLQIHKDIYRLARFVMAVRNLRKAKYINAVSPYTAAENEKFCSVKIDAIPNFEPEWVFNLYRKREWKPNPKITMINSGFNKLKNTHAGMQAFNLLLQHYPDAELHLFGKEHGENEPAHEYAQKNNITRNVKFHGGLHFGELMEKLSDCDLLLHTSLEESCPMVIIEAMAMGIPVIAGEKSGGSPWMLKNGGGILSDITSPEAVCNALVKALAQENFSTLAQQARQEAINRFHPSVVLNQYLELYHKVAK